MQSFLEYQSEDSHNASNTDGGEQGKNILSRGAEHVPQRQVYLSRFADPSPAQGELAIANGNDDLDHG